MVDIRKMYAHVYFDVPQDQLGIAVYALGRVPGFAGALDEQLEEVTGSKNAYKLFLRTLGQDVEPETLRDGRFFTYENLEERLKTLDLLGKLIAKDKKAQVVVDLDDPVFWFNLRLKNLPRQKRYAYEQLTDEEKSAIGEKIQAEEIGRLTETDSEDGLLENAQNLYNSVSRELHPTTGPKDFEGSAKYPAPTPPTFLTSKELNFVYYPGFRGAHNMAKVPKSDTVVYPKKAPSEKKWMTIIIEDTKALMNFELRNAPVQELDRVSEVLARTFFAGTTGMSPETKLMEFNKLVGPVRRKAAEMLIELKRKYSKEASNMPGSWIDLATGQIFKSEEALLAAKDNQEEEQEEYREPLAAKVKELALKLLRNGNMKGFKQLSGLDE